jgi:GNAT superfamily N-acetyltransferase
VSRAADRARGLWEVLAGSVAAFPTDGSVRVAVAPDSLLCPPGWVGVVELEGSALVTVPDDATAHRVDALTALAPGARTDPAAVVSAHVPVTDVLGPARLAYLDAASLTTVELRTASDPVADARADLADVVEVAPDDPGLGALLARVDADDAGESGIAELTSPAFALRRSGEVVAVAGYRAWPGDVAHLAVLTAPEARGHGFGRLVARAATTAALDARLLPQWRARVEPSQRIARSLGYRELGSQLSVRLG